MAGSWPPKGVTPSTRWVTASSRPTEKPLASRPVSFVAAAIGVAVALVGSP
jgi:hypothetical protein